MAQTFASAPSVAHGLALKRYSSARGRRDLRTEDAEMWAAMPAAMRTATQAAMLAAWLLSPAAPSRACPWLISNTVLTVRMCRYLAMVHNISYNRMEVMNKKYKEDLSPAKVPLSTPPLARPS